jgi:DNA-binding MarR family transcriptional regulator
MEDHVDRVVREWQEVRPDLDLSAVEVVARIERAGRLLEREVASTLSRYGLTRGGFAVLSALRRQGDTHRLRPGDLLRGLLSTSGAMTNRIDQLETDGLVRRVPDPDDRRGVLVELTPRGLDLVDRAAAAHLENEEYLLRSLSAQERRRLAAGLRRLLLELEDPAPE